MEICFFKYNEIFVEVNFNCKINEIQDHLGIWSLGMLMGIILIILNYREYMPTVGGTIPQAWIPNYIEKEVVI